MKSGNLNFLEPPGPLQACNGTALSYLTNVFINGNNVYTYWLRRKTDKDTSVASNSVWYNKICDFFNNNNNNNNNIY
jgi:hypothetical protein